MYIYIYVHMCTNCCGYGHIQARTSPAQLFSAQGAKFGCPLTYTTAVSSNSWLKSDDQIHDKETRFLSRNYGGKLSSKAGPLTDIDEKTTAIRRTHETSHDETKTIQGQIRYTRGTTNGQLCGN